MAGHLNELAFLLEHAGEYAGAKALYERAVAIREKALGSEHPYLAQSLHDLGVLRMETGDDVDSFAAAVRAEEISRNHMRLTASALPERQALRYASVRTSGLDTILSLCLANAGTPDPAGIAAVTERAWDSLIRSRALVLDEMAQRHRSSGKDDDPELRRLWNDHASSTQRLANLIVRGPGDDPPERYKRTVDEARNEAEKAEQGLAARGRLFRRTLAGKKAGFGEVLGSLPSGSGLVAFARYSHYAPTRGKKAATTADSEKGRPLSRLGTKAPPPSYMAFVLPPGAKTPVAVPLGRAKEIDALVSRWRSEAGSGMSREEALYRAAGAQLREKIWDPVAAHLGDAKRVFVVPDGELHLVTLASLPVGEQSYLVEKGPLIHYLSAERDLATSGMNEPRGEGLLVLGDPAFDEPSLFASLMTEQEEERRPNAVEKVAAWMPFRGERSGCGSFQSMVFDALPGTARETKEIAALWRRAEGSREKKEQTAYLSGASANEGSFKVQAPGKRVLHLATHGFFLSGKCRSALASSRGITGLVPLGGKHLPPSAGENPLRLSGLALAGFNRRHAAGPGEEDGVLTAEEIASIDLSGVEWAVLSACETGVGEVMAGEGVFGLQRAFKVAGAGTLIMSLWSVEDEATRRWMRALYEARLLGKKDTAQAVRDASLRVLQTRRERKKSTHPFFWEAFVAAGDWK